MRSIFIILFFFEATSFCSNGLWAQTYNVKKVQPGVVILTGKGNAAAWKSGNTLNSFIYPWEKNAAPATSFSALWDGQWLYLLYRVMDDSVNVYTKTNEKREIGASDRVEIFFKIDDKMSPYYCLEMDASGRVLDYVAKFYRQMNYEWQWPKDQLVIKTSRTNDGYILEAAISIASLKELGLINNNQLQAGLFRGECKSLQAGRENLHWISWIDPKSAEPDFHIPAAFGILLLEQSTKY